MCHKFLTSCLINLGTRCTSGTYNNVRKCVRFVIIFAVEALYVGISMDHFHNGIILMVRRQCEGRVMKSDVPQVLNLMFCRGFVDMVKCGCCSLHFVLVCAIAFG